MVNDPLTFACPACGVKLTVPSSMAGITGPCPTCSSIIQAPVRSAGSIPVPPITAPIPEPAPAPAPQIYPSQLPLVPGPPSAPNPPAATETESAVQVQTRPYDVEISSPAVIRVEPRGHKSRTGSHEVIARPMPGPDEYAPVNLPPTSHRRSKQPVRALIILLVLASFAGVFFGVLAWLKHDSTTPLLNHPSKFSTPQKPSAPPSAPAPKSDADVTPAPAAPEPPKTPAAPNPPANASAPVTPGVAALQLLEKFLTASTLAERLPLIETSTPAPELEASVLARPFPHAPRYSPDVQETDLSGNFTDIYYSVDFEGTDGKTNPQVILVRVRPDHPPKVIVDPFLDTFGGRLAAYAATPTTKPGSFQVLVSAVARTTDNTIPNHGEKLRLKLLPRDNEREITNAYFSKLSKISEMLLDDNSGFRYGQARACRVSLSWNTTEDPQKPYLEAIGITELQWNP